MQTGFVILAKESELGPKVGIYMPGTRVVSWKKSEVKIYLVWLSPTAGSQKTTWRTRDEDIDKRGKVLEEETCAKGGSSNNFLRYGFVF